MLRLKNLLRQTNIVENTKNEGKIMENENDAISIKFFPEAVRDAVPADKPEEYMNAYLKYQNDFEGTTIKEEPILSSSKQRYTVYPIEYQTIWNNYKNQDKLRWTVGEVDLSKDVHHWDHVLSARDKYFLMHVLAFFAASDGIVNMNIKKNLIDLVKIKEAECAYGKQFDMENTHAEMYALMLETFVKDKATRDNLINSIKYMPCIRKKAAWCEKWIESDKTFAHKLFAFAIVEGVFFSGSFASIFWLKVRQGALMPGLRKANRFIARDEALHVNLAEALYLLLKNRLSEDVIYQIIDEAVQIEDEYINEALPCRLLGMNSVLMSQYIRYVADRLLVQLGYNKRYNTVNPFDFMNKIDTFHKLNFFEDRGDEYVNANIDNVREFKFVENF